MSRDISIVIPTYNRPKILDMVLDSYCVQEDLKEIVIVNDCSMNEYSFITKYKNKYKDIDFITIDRDKHYGQAAARNTGIKKCTGKYILMGEDDAFLRSDYTKVLKKKIRESKKDGNKIFCCGSIFYDYNPNATKEEQKNTIEVEKNRSDPLFDYKLFLGYYRKGLNEDSQIPFGHALIMVESVAYNGIEYCEEFGGNESREEQDGQLQIAKKGYKCIITPDTECYHLATNLTRKPQSLKQ